MYSVFQSKVFIMGASHTNLVFGEVDGRDRRLLHNVQHALQHVAHHALVPQLEQQVFFLPWLVDLGVGVSLAREGRRMATLCLNLLDLALYLHRRHGAVRIAKDIVATLARELAVQFHRYHVK